jgi:uncharacterized protein
METLELLVDHLRPLRSAVVAFSGGADSALVAWAAQRALGDRALAVTARSESLSEGEAEAARLLARRIGIVQEEIAYSELAIPGYVDNTPDRCYVCKGELFRRLAVLAGERGLEAVLDGTNADDLGDFGQAGARARGLRAPPSGELHWGRRRSVRPEAARTAGWDKPRARPLVAVPYGDRITREKLEQIGRAESALRELGFRELRVRHHGSTARIELPKAEMARVLANGLADEIVRRVREAGFAFVALDLEGLRSGSLNRLLPVAGERKS